MALALATSPDLFGFANLMNAKADELGLAHTHFVNPDGLDAPGAYSTAADVTTLARDAMRVPFIRNTVDQSHGVDRRRAHAAYVERPARESCPA